MAGQNRYFRRGLSERVIKADSRPATCVFIAHKWEERDLAKVVAKELEAVGIDYWLDVDDAESIAAANTGSEEATCQAVERGLVNSSHLLALISPKTQSSWWVPFEIGVARAYARPLIFFVHQEVVKRPAWMSLGAVLADKYDLDLWAKGLSPAPYLVELRKAAPFRGVDSVMPSFRSFQ